MPGEPFDHFGAHVPAAKSRPLFRSQPSPVISQRRIRAWNTTSEFPSSEFYLKKKKRKKRKGRKLTYRRTTKFWRIWSSLEGLPSSTAWNPTRSSRPPRSPDTFGAVCSNIPFALIRNEILREGDIEHRGFSCPSRNRKCFVPYFLASKRLLACTSRRTTRVSSKYSKLFSTPMTR